MNLKRRALAGAAGAAALLPSTLLHGQPVAMNFDPVPALPAQPTPGRPGDFDFLAGRWRVQHLRRASVDSAWDRFDGEATCWTILGGSGSVEELRIPARGFSGMGLRLLDIQRSVWSDFWVNAKSGVLTTPGQEGSFEHGAGIFWSDDEEDGRPVKYAGIWDRITPDSCRWRQVSSTDGGRTWTHHWLMDWRRA